LPALKTTLAVARAGDVLELDELWAYAGSKRREVWLWIALCRRTRQVVSWTLGPRDWYRCQLLREGIPPGYARLDTYSDFWHTYSSTFPGNTAVGKETGETAHVERINGTLRHCLKRLTRKTLAFSKSKTHLQDALEIFFHHYNLSKISG